MPLIVEMRQEHIGFDGLLAPRAVFFSKLWKDKPDIVFRGFSECSSM